MCCCCYGAAQCGAGPCGCGCCAADPTCVGVKAEFQRDRYIMPGRAAAGPGAIQLSSKFAYFGFRFAAVQAG